MSACMGSSQLQTLLRGVLGGVTRRSDELRGGAKTLLGRARYVAKRSALDETHGPNWPLYFHSNIYTKFEPTSANPPWSIGPGEFEEDTCNMTAPRCRSNLSLAVHAPHVLLKVAPRCMIVIPLRSVSTGPTR